MKKHVLFLSMLLFISMNYIVSQPSEGGFPKNFSLEKSYVVADNLEVVNFYDLKKLWAEDFENNGKDGNPPRIGVALPTDFSKENFQTVRETSEGKVYTLKLHAANASAISIEFNEWHLAPGCEMFMYNENRKQVLGAFTSNNNLESGTFSTELIQGETVYVEYFEPYNLKGQSNFHIYSIGYFYHGLKPVERFMDDDMTKIGGFTTLNQSDACQVNVNCSPEGDAWKNQKNGVAMIILKVGSSYGLCSGDLINNTRNDGTPYLLTAFHCEATQASTADLNAWKFYFRYEATGCTNPTAEPSTAVAITGCSLKAYGDISGGSDFTLLLLNSTPTAAYTPYYNGWDRSNSNFSNAVGIHHPSGDITKISYVNGSSSYAAPNIDGSVMASNSALRVTWKATTNGHGVTEGGSSGSPLFNSNGLQIGTLTGGSSYCTATSSPDYYGRFYYHWDQNGTAANKSLKSWLDPDNTGATTCPGYDPFAAPQSPIDVQLTSITSPNSGANLSATENVTVAFKNNGTNALTSMTLAYFVNNTVKQTATWTGNLASNATSTYTFSTKADLSAAGTYSIKVEATLTGDANTADNTITKSVTNTICGGLPMNEYFEGITPTNYTTAGNLPDCWLSYTENTSYPAPHVFANGGYGTYLQPSTQALLFVTGSAGNNAYAILPELANAGTATLSFTQMLENLTYGQFYVGYVTDASSTANVVSSFVSKQTITKPTAIKTWKRETMDLSTWSIPVGARLAIRFTNANSYYGGCIDSVSVVANVQPTTPGCGTVAMADWTYGQTASNPVPTSTCQGTAGVTYSYTGRNSTTYSASATKPSAVGEYTVTATFPANATYMQHTATANFAILQGSIQPFVCDGIDTELDNFTPYLDSLKLYLASNGGMLSGPNGYGDLGKFEKIIFPNNGTLTDIYYAVTHAVTTTGSVTLKIYANNQSTSLFNETMAISSLISDEYGFFTLPNPIAVTAGQIVYVGFEWAASTPLTDSFAVYQVVSTAISTNTAYEIWDDNSWNDMSEAWWNNVRKTSLLVGVGYCAEETDGGCEGFDNLSLSNTTNYSTGSFTGANGIVWNYTAAQKANNSNTNYPINGSGVILRRSSDNSNVTSDSISGGCGTLTLNYRKAYTGTGNRNFAIYVNGQLIYTSPNFGNASGASATVYPVSVNVNVAGKFVIKVANTSSNQLTIDDICWTPYEAPEPQPGCGSVTITGWGEWQAPNAPVASSNCQGTANVTFTYVGVAPTVYAENSLVPSAVGTYKVIAHFPATVNYTAANAEAEFEIISSAVANLDLNDDAISIYPNPVETELNVQCAICNVQCVEIFDITGKLYSTLHFNDNTTKINVVDLKPGAYFLKIDDKVFKFIKK